MTRTVFVLFLLLAGQTLLGQAPEVSKYNMELGSMIRSGEPQQYNDIQASLLLTPKDTADYPPVLSMRIGYRVNDQDSITYIDIGKQQPQQVRLTIYGETLPEKNPKLYARIGSKLDFEKQQDLMILFFEFRNLSREKIQKVSITYGVWEKNNLERRVEETFSMEFEE